MLQSGPVFPALRCVCVSFVRSSPPASHAQTRARVCVSSGAAVWLPSRWLQPKRELVHRSEQLGSMSKSTDGEVHHIFKVIIHTCVCDYSDQR